jgi:N-methylhydantoinase B
VEAPPVERGGRVAIMPDPITLELISGALRSAIHEMETLVDRTAMSAIIKEKKDYFVGLYDARGRMVDAQISFTGPGLVEPVLKTYPLEEMRPGDVFWFNDPYFTDGAIQHLGDMVFMAPVFAEIGGRGSGIGDDDAGLPAADPRSLSSGPIAFSACFGHFRDLGGTRAGSISPGATEIFHEGTRVPPIRIMRAGELNREAYRVILANSRFPEDMEGDSRALMAACRLGVSRLEEMIARFGRETLLEAFDALIARTGAAARAMLRRLVPEGEYHFWDAADGDGFTDRPYRIDIRLIRRGDHITVDLSGSDEQARGPINFLATHGFVNLLFGRYLMALDPALGLNEGLFGIIDEVITKPGTVVHPRFPAATGLRSHVRLRLGSAMLGALNLATGGDAPAASPVYVLYTLRMLDEATGTFDVCSEGVGAGLGARPFADGTDVIYFIAQRNFPIEFVEREHAIRVERFQIATDSGGPGRWRGGCGVTREVRVLAEHAVLSTRLDNVRFPCWGANGGRAGRTGEVVVNPGTEGERRIPPIADDVELHRGDLLRITTGGGGGWGDPFAREPERVRLDVLRGFVSLAGARADYGVALDPETLDLDPQETERLRAAPRPAPEMFDRGIGVTPA